MSNLLELNSDSSDSESDCDYVPPGEVTDPSEDEESDVEPQAAVEACYDIKNKKKRTRKRKKDDVSEEDEIKENSKLSEEEEKERAKSLWNDFLQDVNPPAVKKKQVNNLTNQCASRDDKPVDSLSKSGNKAEKVTISEVFEFAGEAVVVTKEVESHSEEAKKHNLNSVVSNSASKSESKATIQPKLGANASGVKRHGGLGSVIGNILNKKQKLTTLEKSLLDWKTFKKEEGIEEELEQHNRGKGGYLEKQAFLQRSDLRQFEVEKSVRLINRNKR